MSRINIVCKVVLHCRVLALALEVLNLSPAAINSVNAPASGDDASATACNLSQSCEMPATESSNYRLGDFTTSFEGATLQLELEGAAVRRRYRELSAVVHPDKCTHPDAEKVCGTMLSSHMQSSD